MAALLGFGTQHPRARRAAFALLSSLPSAFEALLRIAASEPLRAAPPGCAVAQPNSLEL